MFVVEIDPREKSINMVEFKGESVGLSDMYGSLECDIVERLALSGDFDLWIDEEGQLNGASDRIGEFVIGDVGDERSESYQFVGKGLICSSNDDGDSIPFPKEIAQYILDNLIIKF